MIWTPMMCFAVISGVFVAGEYLSRLTKGFMSSLVFGCFIAMGLYWSGIIPKSIADTSTLLSTLYGVGIGLLLVNMGTSIELESLMQEWRTVAVCCAGLAGIAIMAFTVGIAVFGREYALTAAPVVAGGTIAYQIVAEAAVTAGKPVFAGFAALILAFQSLIGMPVASYCLKKVLIGLKRDGTLSDNIKNTVYHLPKTEIFTTPSEKANTSTLKFFKISLVAVTGYAVSVYIFPFVNVNIMYLLAGIIARKINFLQKEPLKSAGGYGYVMLCMYALTFNGFSAVSVSDAVGFIIPVLGTLITGVLGIVVMSVIAGRLLGHSPYISIAVGVSALFGYPGTEIVSNEVVNTMEDFSPEEKDRALAFIMPKMIVGGFTTVTVASVVFAGIVVPLIFR